MQTFLGIFVGAATAGLPIWFWLLDRRLFPRLKWVGPSDPAPRWSRLVVVVGVGLAVLMAMAAPIGEFAGGH